MKTKLVTIDEVSYEIKEPTVGVLFPIMDLMEKDPKAFQLGLVKTCVSVNGAPIGEGINDVGLKTYIKLMQEVLEVAGLSGDAQGNV
jgi:hypothetical protein